MGPSWDAQSREEGAAGDAGVEVGWDGDVEGWAGVACGCVDDGGAGVGWRRGERGGRAG